MNKEKCKCGGMYKPSKALISYYKKSEFKPTIKVVKLINCMKCEKCGNSYIPE